VLTLVGLALVLLGSQGCSTAPQPGSGESGSSTSPSPRSSAELLAECRTAASSSSTGSLTYDVAVTLVGKPFVACLDEPSGSGPTLKDIPADWSAGGGDWLEWVSTDRPLPSNCEVGDPPTVLVYVGGQFLNARNPVCSGGSLGTE
jgi:hypothetical protein